MRLPVLLAVAVLLSAGGLAQADTGASAKAKHHHKHAKHAKHHDSAAGSDDNFASAHDGNHRGADDHDGVADHHNPLNLKARWLALVGNGEAVFDEIAAECRDIRLTGAKEIEIGSHAG